MKAYYHILLDESTQVTAVPIVFDNLALDLYNVDMVLYDSKRLFEAQTFASTCVGMCWKSLLDKKEIGSKIDRIRLRSARNWNSPANLALTYWV